MVVNNTSTNEAFPLTDIQLAYLLGRNPALYLGGNSTHFYAEVITKLDPVRLQAAFNKEIRRQPMLRTVILPEGRQLVLEEVPEFVIENADLRGLPQEQQEKKILEKREAASHRIFRSDEWPLFGFAMYRTSDEEYRFIADFDMMIVDGLSIEIMINETLEFYEDPDREVKETDYSFRDYIYEHSAQVESARDEDERFWDRQAPLMPLGPELPVQVDDGRVYRFRQKEHIISADVWQKMKQELMRNRVIPALYLFACYGKMLSVFSGQRHFTINLTTTNRKGDISKLGNVIGDFTEIIPLDISFDNGQSVLEAAKEAQKRLAKYRRYSTIGGVRIMKKVSDANALKTGVPFPVVFTSMLFDTAQSGWSRLGERVYQISQTPQVLLDSTVTERQGSLILRWDYLFECFPEGFIDDMFDHYVTETESAVTGKDAVPEGAELWTVYNDTADSYIPEKTLYQLFEEKAELYPERTAFICGEESITYRELYLRSRRTAAYIAEKYGLAKPVVLEAHRSIETVVWMLAVLRCGGFYIPADPSWPDSRKQFILENSKADAIVDPLDVRVPEGCDTDAVPADDINSLAYIIYTSGSTGTPKGVAISNRAVSNTIQDMNYRFGITEKDILIGISSFCFDLSVYDVFGALAAGASCVIMRNRTDISEYERIFRQHGITVWNSVPAILEMVINNSSITSGNMRNIFLSGDWIPLDLPAKAKERFNEAAVTSLGGATEASIWSIYYPIEEVSDRWKSIPYGYPLANQTIYVLDSEQKLCPVYTEGEICIGGRGVAEGYLNDREKTDAQFFEHPVYGRLYRTGDYGCLSREGYVIFKGRRDEQVKLHGYRVELEEIENRLRLCSGVSEAAVIAENDSLTGYIVRETEDTEGAERFIREHGDTIAALSEKLPEDISTEEYRRCMTELDEAAVGIIAGSLAELGAVREDGELCSIDEITESGTVTEGYRKVLQQWMDSLYDKGYITEKNGARYLSREAFRDADVIIEKVLANGKMAYWKDFFGFVTDCREHMKEILSGVLNPVTLLFPGGDDSRAENYYRKNPVAEYYNRIAAGAVKSYTAAHSDRTVRIFEAGAGTGGTTCGILEAIKGMDTEYTFTDLSTFFTDKAKKKLSEYRNVRYGLFSIDEGPQSQGYEAGAYDIVIAANVLHDASSVSAALKNLSELLSSEGMIVLLETTESRLIQKVSVGLIEGFSSYSDERKQPLMSVAQWKDVFAQSGYGAVSVYPAKGNGDYDQHILIAVPEKKYRYVSPDGLRQELRSLLPAYMIPDRFYTIEELPVSQNGKIKKALLPRFAVLAHTNTEDIVQPETDTEKKLCGIFMKEIGNCELSTEANLFELGIDSLKAISAVTECNNNGLDISLVDLYSSPTIRQLAAKLDEKNGSQDAVTVNYSDYTSYADDEYGSFELNDIQKAYLYGRNPAFELGNTSSHYYAEIECSADISLLESSLNEVIKQQPALRTVIRDDGTQQVLESTEPYHITVDDLSGISEDEKGSRKQALRETMSHQVHKTGKWPMFELRAVHNGSGSYTLYFSLDVMIADGASILMLWNEIAAGCRGRSPQPLSFTFADYQCSLRRLENSEIYKEDERYWTEKAEDFPDCPELPYRIPFANVDKPHFSRKSAVIGRSEWERFNENAKRRGFTPAAMLCSAYATVLARYSGSSRFALNLTLFNRYPFHEDVSRMIGDFTSTCILDIHTDCDFLHQTEMIQQTIFGSMEHRHYDGIRFLRQLSKKKGDALAAVMPVVFTCALFNSDMSDLDSIGKISYIQSQTPQAALDNQTTSLNGELHVAWDYVSQLFDDGLITDMFNSYVSLIRSAAADEVPCFDNSAAEKMMYEYNRTDRDYTPVTLDSLFASQVKLTPDHTALICGERYLTYRQLDEMSSEIASFLTEKGQTGRRVAVLGEKTPETVAAFIGIAKAGSCYVPLSPDYPEQRISSIMENSGCELLLDTAFITGNILGRYSSFTHSAGHSPDDMAYIIYTSGSTGAPKGVVISHKAAANTILDINRRFGIGRDDRFIGISNFNFDLSVYDVWGALTTGAVLVLVKDYRNISEVRNILERQSITFWNSVPAIMQMAVETMEEGRRLPALKNVLLSGDWIPVDLPGKIRKIFPSATVTSLGGATEASIWSIYYPINDVIPGQKSIPYGYPLDNQRFWVLDDNMEICPVGVRGELYIGGIGLAEGYMNNTAENEKRFITHDKLGRIYRTGDHGIFHREGYIEFLGRTDDQVKLHGYRIELEEISAVLKKHDKVSDAVTIVTDGSSRSVLSYIVPAKELPSEPSADVWDSTVAAAEANADMVPEEISAEKYSSYKKILDNDSFFLLTDTIRKMYADAYGISAGGREIDILQFIRDTGIREKYSKVIRGWFMELEKEGFAERTSGNTFILAEDEKLSSIKPCDGSEYRNAPEAEYFEEALRFLALCRNSITDILTGRKNILDLLFPEGRWDVADNLYKTNPVAGYYNRIVAETMAAYISGRKDIRILETGAGIGGTTAAVLRRLADEDMTYTYTDLSTFFTDKAREVYSGYSDKLAFGIFDINLTPQEQNYEVENYDVIMAANMMHDAKDIGATLHSFRNMLRPGGMLIFLEHNRNTKLHMVTTALIDGFSDYNDFRLEQNSALLPAEEWIRLLSENGFIAADSFPHCGSTNELYGQNVIIARKDSRRTFLSSDETDELKELAGKYLPDYMVPDRIIQLDSLPLSANGKVSRKLLPKPAVTVRSISENELPETDTEKLLYAKWASVLGTEQFSVTDDFYEAGGDSLKAIQLISELNADKELDIKRFMEGTSVRKLARYLDEEGISIK